METAIAKYDYNFVKDILALINKDGLPTPFSREIFLINVHIAGTSYVEDIEEIESELIEGDMIVMKREPDNQYDELAILILDKKGRKIGYVPRNNNAILARLMDAGKIIFAKIISKNRADYWLKIDIEIYLKEI